MSVLLTVILRLAALQRRRRHDQRVSSLRVAFCRSRVHVLAGCAPTGHVGDGDSPGKREAVPETRHRARTPAVRVASPRAGEAMATSTTRTDFLTELRSGHQSLNRLLPLVYHELRAIAHRRLSPRDHGGTLSTTALVHEAYLRLVDQSQAERQARAHFLAVASLAMPRVLVDRARARGALKRGGECRRITLDEEQISVDEQPEALLQ